MAKNAIQFQPGMSLMKFLDQYGSESQRREALAGRAGPRGCAAKRVVMRVTAISRVVMCTSGTAASGRYH